jgi:hypothetical protein
LSNLRKRKHSSYSRGKTSVQIVIQLDIKPEEAETLYLEFLRLSHLDKLVIMYKDSELDIQPLLNLFRIVKQRGMNDQDILNVLKYVKEIPYLKDTYEQLIKDVDGFDYKRCKFREELSFLQYQLPKLRNALKWYKSELEVKTKQVSELNLKKR